MLHDYMLLNKFNTVLRIIRPKTKLFVLNDLLVYCASKIQKQWQSIRFSCNGIRLFSSVSRCNTDDFLVWKFDSVFKCLFWFALLYRIIFSYFFDISKLLFIFPIRVVPDYFEFTEKVFDYILDWTFNNQIFCHGFLFLQLLSTIILLKEV